MLIALLIMLILVGVGALGASEIWATTRKREREAELLWVGDQYRKAIESFWKATPGGRKILPTSIDQLLNDPRFPVTLHHLRQPYRDPMTEDGEFEAIVINNALVGVHSKSTDKPMKVAQFPARYQQFADAEDYSGWKFIYMPPNAYGAPRANPSAPTPGVPGFTVIH